MEISSLFLFYNSIVCIFVKISNMLKEREVKSYMIRLYCDECGEEMVSTGQLFFSYPLQLEHKCPKCGYVLHTTEGYPKVIYKEI